MQNIPKEQVDWKQRTLFA